MLTLSGMSSHLSDIRVVLLGSDNAGKSSSGNTILGREEFELKRRTAQCVKRQGEVAGRQLTVVEAPGWWKNKNLKDSPELTKQEIVLSVSLCPPGPHILLLHVRVDDTVTPEYIENMMEHVDHLSDGVWSHTMVLFTRGDRLGDTSIEHHIESEGALQSLVEKCGNRYHVLNNMDKGDREQITELLEKMEEIICGNGGCHYEMDRKRLEEVMKRREEDEERATVRLMKVEEQRQHLQSLKKLPPQSEFRIVLLGYRSSGKSSSGNTILGREEFHLEGITAQCEKRQGEVAGRQLTVVRAPGWWKHVNLKNTPELTKQEIVLSVSLCPPGPHIFLLHVRVAQPVTPEYIENMMEHVDHLSDGVWSHTMVLFTRGDWLGDTPIEQYIESEGALQSLVEKCGNRYHVLNNMDKGDRKQITELLEKMEEIICGNGGRHYEMDRKGLKEVMKRREEDEERATARLMMVEKLRQLLQSQRSEFTKYDNKHKQHVLKSRSGEFPVLNSFAFLFSLSKFKLKLLRLTTVCSLDFVAKTKATLQQVSSVLGSSYDSSDLLTVDSGYVTRVPSATPTDSSKVPSATSTDSCLQESSSEIALMGSGTSGTVDKQNTTAKPTFGELDNSTGKSQSVFQHHQPTNHCQSCEHIQDTSHWIKMTPAVSMETGVPVYTHSSPPGSFECTVSGLRWVCKVDVTLQYHFCDPDIFRAELAMLQYTPIGPLMDIKVLSGELLEAHLPHFVCLDDSDTSLSEAVRVLRADDSGVNLETCELTRFHAKILNPSFSLTELLVKIGIPMKTHLEVLIYRTRVTPLVLLTYVVPRDASMIQAAEDDVHKSPNAKMIKTHRPDMSIWMHTRFSLMASLSHAEIFPEGITLKYITPPCLFRVDIENVESRIELKLISEEQIIWKATLHSYDFDETGLEAQLYTMPLAASRHPRDVISKEVSNTSSAARAEEKDKKMASMSNEDRLSRVRPKLINRTSRATLKGLLDELQAQCPPVISSREAEEILHRSSVLQEQVTAFIDALLKKGDKACGIMFSLLEELDSYLYHDLGL
ncbi:hypothetical protein ACEWY4_017225 [Coilia grayii]|uniref:GTPase IMAP family member 8-like n=1 Tax=Coilia grayii TaxID=363190 RepID=A0ABD1JJ52_9TELE